ncbi:MAG: hypothetical protein ACRDZX_15170 [Acidimicrobiales bacterium]
MRGVKPALGVSEESSETLDFWGTIEVSSTVQEWRTSGRDLLLLHFGHDLGERALRLAL